MSKDEEWNVPTVAPDEEREPPAFETIEETINLVKIAAELSLRELASGLEKVDWDQIQKVMESVIALEKEDRDPELVIDLGFGMGIYLAKWMPEGEIWFFDKGEMADATRLFANILLAGVKGRFGLLFPRSYTTDDIIELFSKYLRMHTVGRIENLKIDREECTNGT